MSKLPIPSRPKDLPETTEIKLETPVQSELIETQPESTPTLQIVPAQTPQLETVPKESPLKEEMPSDLIEENCVVIGGKKIEIKPTKLKYFRNKGASAYGIIKAVPLHELLTYGKGVLDEKRDADQLLFDFLVAVFDDSDFVTNNYEELDADIVDRVVKIFGRINHIDEKEEVARKNKEAQAKH